MTVNPFALQSESRNPIDLMPKMELPEYISDDDNEQDDNSLNFYAGGNDAADLPGNNRVCMYDIRFKISLLVLYYSAELFFLGGIEVTAQTSNFNGKDIGPDLNSQGKLICLTYS